MLCSQLICLDEKQVSAFRRLVVVGDLHGDYSALCSLLKVVSPTKDGLIFLGDYADRGSFGVEVIEKSFLTSLSISLLKRMLQFESSNHNLTYDPPDMFV